MELTQDEKNLIYALRKQKEEEMGLLTIDQPDDGRGLSNYVRKMKFAFKADTGLINLHTSCGNSTGSHGFFFYEFNKEQAQEVVNYFTKFIQKG